MVKARKPPTRCPELIDNAKVSVLPLSTNCCSRSGESSVDLFDDKL